MKFEIRSLKFNKLLVYETKQLRTDWQEGIFLMEDFTLTADIYKNGPVFFSVQSEENEDKFGHFTYYLPINETVSLDDETHFRFIEDLCIDEALVLRQADQEVDFYSAYRKVKEYAIDNRIELEDKFYCVLIEVYGDIIIDIYVPIKDRSEKI